MKITRLLLVLAALATGVFAQETPAPAAAATPADPAKLTLAREVIAVMKADRMFEAMYAQMKQSAAQITAVPPDATPELRQKATELQEKIVEVSMTAGREMVAKMDQVYAEVYSEAELNAMKTFFSTAEGQSMLAKQPQVMAHVMPLVQELQRTLIPKVQKMVEDAKLTANPPVAVPTPTSELPPPPPEPPAK